MTDNDASLPEPGDFARAGSPEAPERSAVRALADRLLRFAHDQDGATDPASHREPLTPAVTCGPSLRG
jgi:hypothetical protein